jgi:hypothetical protein
MSNIMFYREIEVQEGGNGVDVLADVKFLGLGQT